MIAKERDCRLMLRVKPTENFRELINPVNLNEAFRNYHSQLALNNQPLAFLATVSQREAQLANEKNVPANLRGAALAAELKSLISSLEPKDSNLPSSHSSRYPYEILNHTNQLDYLFLFLQLTNVRSRFLYIGS